MRRERLILACVLLASLLSVTLPYLYAARVTPAGMTYTGLLWLPDDQNVHLTWARQAADGAFFLPNLYTSESLGQPTRFTNVVLSAVGWTHRLTGLPLVLCYHLFRVAGTLLTLYALYRLVSLVSASPFVRIGSVVLAAFATGFGFLPWPPALKLMDQPFGYLFVPEAYTFTSALIYPLNVCSTALFLGTFYFTLRSQGHIPVQERAEPGSRPRPYLYATLAGLCALVLGNAHTYDSVPLLAILVLHAAFTWRRVALWPMGVTLVLATVPVLLQGLVFLTDPQFRWSKTHHRVDPLPLPDTLLSYGLLVPLAVYGGVLAWRGRNPAARLLVLWPVVTLLVMYLPGIPFGGRKFVEGLNLPLAALAALALCDLALRLPASRRLQVAGLRSLLPSLLLLLCCANAPFIVAGLLRHRTDESWPAPRTPLDLPADYLAAVAALDRLPDKSRVVVLAMPPWSNHIPPRSGVRVYVGHWAESVRFVAKFWYAHNFFNNAMSPEDQREFLARNQITHILQGPLESSLAAGQSAPLPSDRLSLNSVFESPTASLYALPGSNLSVPHRSEP